MSDYSKLTEIVEVAEIANLLVNVAQGAGIPVIGLITTIGANFAKGKEITPEDIADSIAKAEAANESLARAIAEKKALYKQS